MTYWIIVLLFVCSVLVPDVVRRDVLLFQQEEAEALTLFVLVGAMSVIALWHERAARRAEKTLRRTHNELRHTTSDLGHAYSHIGELNRKCDLVAQHCALMTKNAPTTSPAHLCTLLRNACAAICRHSTIHVYLTDRVKNHAYAFSDGAPAMNRVAMIATDRATDKQCRTHADVIVNDTMSLTIVHCVPNGTALYDNDIFITILAQHAVSILQQCATLPKE